MEPTDIITGAVWEDSTPFLMARLVDIDNKVLTKDDVSSIACKVFDLDAAPQDEGTSVAVVKANVIFDTLQTGERWTADTTGYNFGHALPAARLSEGDHRYRIEYIFTLADETTFPVVYILTALDLWSS